MKNRFYQEFDFARLNKSSRENDYRTPFQIDRDRIIHSSEFRRLQGKTQVFLPGHYDFYRTRLTHSIEVAQIGRSICYYLLNKETNALADDFFIDPDLVESICLAHDLGHPPFGHAGERTLNRLMKKYGGFEGNAQTLRLINDVFYKSGNVRRGMKPSRGFVDGILKYKSLYGDLDNPHNHFLYDEQKKYVDFVFGDQEIPSEFTPGNKLNSFKSIECQIMDWADDTAYVINDLVDSIFGGFISILSLEKWAEKRSSVLTDNQMDAIAEIIGWIKVGDYKAKFGSQIGSFIQACCLEESTNFMSHLTNRYKFNLKVEEKIREKAELYKRISVELVFQSSNLHQMEHKGNVMIKQMFELLEENYIQDSKEIKLLPDFSDAIIREEADLNQRARLVCDYIAGMTDAFAMRTYKRLFDPDYSSLADFV